jgi:hypothetical protein
MPFARNEATRFISPTKTPEYLASGRPVVSTAIRDVVRPYGERGLVAIAETPAQFVAAIEAQLPPIIVSTGRCSNVSPKVAWGWATADSNRPWSRTPLPPPKRSSWRR